MVDRLLVQASWLLFRIADSSSSWTVLSLRSFNGYLVMDSEICRFNGTNTFEVVSFVGSVKARPAN